MPQETDSYLLNISQSINQVLDEHLKDIETYREFDKNVDIHEAIEIELIVIGEAMQKLRDEGITLPFNDQIISLCQTLSSHYNRRNGMNVWRCIQNDIPSLKDEVERLLED